MLFRGVYAVLPFISPSEVFRTLSLATSIWVLRLSIRTSQLDWLNLVPVLRNIVVFLHSNDPDVARDIAVLVYIDLKQELIIIIKIKNLYLECRIIGVK